MIDFILLCVNAATILAGATIFVLCAMMTFRRTTLTESAFTGCFGQVKTSQKVSLLLIGMVWFLMSGQDRRSCMEGYVELSERCGYIGSAWIALALSTLVFGILMSLFKHSSEDNKRIAMMRTSCFVYGAVYLLISFLLNVQ